MDLDGEPASASLFVPWSIFEHRDVDGQSMADLFRSECARELSPRELAWLDANALARFGIWEVVELDRGRSVRVRNLLTYVERLVLERAGSERLALREAVLARVVVFDGIAVFCGMHPRPLGAREAQSLVRSVLEGLGGKRARRLDEKTLSRPDFSNLLIELWERAIDEIASRPPPKLMTTDGEELVPVTETFQIVDASSGTPLCVRDRLLALPHATPEEDSAGLPAQIAFIRPNPPGSQLDTTVLGHARVTADAVVMETLSRERADQFRAQIERTCGGLVAFVSREERDPAEMFGHASGRASARTAEERAPVGEREARPPEAAAALVELKARSYCDWCDHALPALGGKTPREAAKARSRKLRDEVDLLVCEIEAQESMLHPSERFDVRRLREELGIRSA